jgi:hypothetical protein
MAKADRTASLEHEMDELRDRLAETIDQLVYRASPKTIATRQVAAIKAVYVDPRTGQPRTDNIATTVGGIVGAVALVVVLRRLTAK